ncbi:MAG: hypothetical protein AB7R00_27115 [Kofleriaceae bacterium]
MRYLALCLLIVVGTGCYETQIGRRTHAPVIEDRQWFTVNGLIKLSDPTPNSCAKGIAYSSSRYGIGDILIAAGIGLAGGMLGAAMLCDRDQGEASLTACIGGTATLATFLLQSRSVEVQCR